MKKVFGIALVAMVSLGILYPTISSSMTSSSEKGGINFIHQDYQKAIAEAKAQNKLVFVDAYASWCGPCKVMDKKVFSDKNVAAYFNEHFINVKVMVEDARSATPEGAKFSQTYEFDAYPTMFFLDGDGKVVKKIIGYHDARQLINQAEKTQK